MYVWLSCFRHYSLKVGTGVISAGVTEMPIDPTHKAHPHVNWSSPCSVETKV